MIKHTKASAMLDSMFKIILREDPGSELEFEGLSGSKKVQGESLKKILIKRCGSSDDKLSLATLKLFDSILGTFNQFSIYNLVLIDISNYNNDNAISNRIVG